MNRRVIAAALLLCALTGSWAFAGAPSTIAYQGQILESGAAVTGSRDVLVSFCPDPNVAVASCLPTVRQTVAVANGLFRSTYSVPSGVDLTTGFWWLDLQEGPQGGTLQEFLPREMFSSGAYALYASSVSALTAAPGSAGVILSSAVAIGTMTPTAMLDVQGNALLRDGFQLGVSSSACTSASSGTVVWNGTNFQFCDGIAWNSIVNMNACANYFCPQNVLNSNGGRCCCPAGTILMSGSASGWYYSLPTGGMFDTDSTNHQRPQACTGTVTLPNANGVYDGTVTKPANGMIGWRANVSLPLTQGITPMVNLICCPY